MADCTCPDPYCPEHARCVMGHDDLIIEPGEPAFCPECEHDVMPVGACKRPCGERVGGGRCVMAAGHAGPHGQVGLR